VQCVCVRVRACARESQIAGTNGHIRNASCRSVRLNAVCCIITDPVCMGASAARWGGHQRARMHARVWAVAWACAPPVCASPRGTAAARHAPSSGHSHTHCPHRSLTHTSKPPPRIAPLSLHTPSLPRGPQDIFLTSSRARKWRRFCITALASSISCNSTTHSTPLPASVHPCLVSARAHTTKDTCEGGARGAQRRGSITQRQVRLAGGLLARWRHAAGRRRGVRARIMFKVTTRPTMSSGCSHSLGRVAAMRMSGSVFDMCMTADAARGRAARR
jgi:hypothetical protein